MKNITLLFLFLSSVCYGEIACIQGYVVVNSTKTLLTLSQSVNYNSEKFIMADQQTLKYDDKFSVKISTGKIEYPIDFTIRLPLKDKFLLYNNLDDIVNLLKLNDRQIIKGELYKHTCHNDGIPGQCKPCTLELIWSK